MYEAMNRRDEALYTLMYRCSPSNLPFVRRAVSTVLGEQIEAGDETAYFVAQHLARHFRDADPQTVRLWEETRGELRTKYQKEMDAWRRAAPWPNLYGEVDLPHFIANFGVSPLYRSNYFLTGSGYPVVERMLTTPGMAGDTSALCTALLTAPRPWISDPIPRVVG